MKNRTETRGIIGEWTIRFLPASSILDCRHNGSGMHIRGPLHFWARDRHGALIPWRLEAGMAGDAYSLSLLDPDGNRQGYLAMDASGETLRLSVIERPPQRYQGVLRFEGKASLGTDTFACRTLPPHPSDDVVQMASGPADSLLNDSLFDIQRDTAVLFRAEKVRITALSDEAKRKPSFNVEMEALAGDTGLCELVIVIERNFYRSRYVPWYRPVDKSRVPSPPTGWMSWNVYFDQAGEKENLDEARVGAEYLKPYGLEIWSIESWQDNSAQLPVSNFHNLTLRPYTEQFPHGMKWLADQIRKLGFRPGIWTVPFGTGDEGFYRQHKGWFLHFPDGKPMRNWSGRFVLDPSQPAVRRHMYRTHRIIAQEWGYEFFKIDGISGRGPHYSAHFFERPEVRRAFKNECLAPLEECLHALRRGIGSNRIMLACQGHYTGPDAAVADAARIGSDVVAPGKPPQWHNYLAQAMTTLVQLFVHNIVWYNDPDTLLVGRFASLDVARLAATVVALPGQVMFAGDKLAELPPERMWLLQRCLPVCDVRPLDLYPIYTLKRIWDLKIKRPFGSWDILSLFNFDEHKACRIGFQMADIGLDPDAVYLAFDFWNGRFLGKVREGFELSLKPKSNALLSLHPYLGHPQFLSTNRHITQGGVSLEALAWSPDTLALSGRTKLVADETTTLSFYVPEGFHIMGAEAKGARACISPIEKDRTATLRLHNERPVSMDWCIRFGRGSATASTEGDAQGS